MTQPTKREPAIRSRRQSRRGSVMRRNNHSNLFSHPARRPRCHTGEEIKRAPTRTITDTASWSRCSDINGSCFAVPSPTDDTSGAVRLINAKQVAVLRGGKRTGRWGVDPCHGHLQSMARFSPPALEG